MSLTRQEGVRPWQARDIFRRRTYRRIAMLRTAFCPVVREALEEADTIEVMANPDGSVWIEKTGAGLILSDHRLDSSDRPGWPVRVVVTRDLILRAHPQGARP